MGYRLLGDAVMLVHFGFLVFLIVGGFLAWRWPRLIVVHLVTAAWGLLSVTVGVTCPLTTWEDALRRRVDGLGLERGFIDTYLTGVVYPAEYLRTVQLVVAALVVVSWVGFAVRRRAVRGSTRASPGGPWSGERAASARTGR
ncbi:MAG: DUF2784 domain-containing protein [Pseudonocardia sp.]